MELDIEKSGNNSRTYSFSEELSPHRSLSWLSSNRSVESFDVKDKVLTIRAKSGTDWDSLENDFIMPGLERTFGQLKVRYHAHH